VVEQAAQTDPEMAELWSTMGDNRLFGARHVAGLVKAKGATWPDVDGDRAADILFLFNDPSVYRTLVIDRAGPATRSAAGSPARTRICS
jgi:hypothetical protein